MEWIKCEICGEEREQVFIIEFRTHHCSPSTVHDMAICDQCLDERGVDADRLVVAIEPASKS